MRLSFLHIISIALLLFGSAAVATEAPADLTPSPPSSARWAWLAENGGTYWYVPTANLQAFQWNTDDPAAASAVEDQTVWFIQRYENGYFFGPAVAQLSGRSAMCQYMIGSVTPDGRVYIAFNSQPERGTPSITTGIGEMVQASDGWAFRMQMASGSERRQVAHWADMLQCRQGEPCWNDLPGTGGSIENMLAQCDQD
jgi:hypothetical protein